MTALFTVFTLLIAIETIIAFRVDQVQRSPIDKFVTDYINVFLLHKSSQIHVSAGPEIALTFVTDEKSEAQRATHQ